jgi:hypothetical protein
MQTGDQSIAETSATIETMDAWKRVKAARQVADYIYELTAELSRLALAVNCSRLASLLQIAGLEAKKLSREHGCEEALNAVHLEGAGESPG